MRRLSITSLLLAFAAAVSGCSAGIIGEAFLDLPPIGSDAEVFAVVQFQISEDGVEPVDQFMDDWRDGRTLDGFPLNETERTDVHISVIGQPEFDRKDLLVRVRYCGSALCDAIGDDMAPESHFVVERAFYNNEVTEFDLPVATLPTEARPEPVRIPYCSVRGCRPMIPGRACRIDDTHFCEEGSDE